MADSNVRPALSIPSAVRAVKGFLELLPAKIDRFFSWPAGCKSKYSPPRGCKPPPFRLAFANTRFIALFLQIVVLTQPYMVRGYSWFAEVVNPLTLKMPCNGPIQFKRFVVVVLVVVEVVAVVDLVGQWSWRGLGRGPAGSVGGGGGSRSGKW